MMGSPQFDFNKYPDKLNLGCGFDVRVDYLNVDLYENHNPDLIADVTNLWMLPSGWYSEILAFDILEHISWTRTENILKEWNRLLKEGGELHLKVPNVLGIARLLMEATSPVLHEEYLRCLFGTQCYPGDFHLSGFTDSYLVFLLDIAGFTVSNISEVDRWMIRVVATKRIDQYVNKLFLVDSDEEFLQIAYSEILGRAIDEVGKSHWLAMLNQNISREAVINALKASEEYRLKAEK